MSDQTPDEVITPQRYMNELEARTRADHLLAEAHIDKTQVALLERRGSEWRALLHQRDAAGKYLVTSDGEIATEWVTVSAP